MNFKLNKSRLTAIILFTAVNAKAATTTVSSTNVDTSYTLDGDDTITVEAGASIVRDGAGEDAIKATGDNNTIDIRGYVSATRDVIQSTGDNNIINISGTVNLDLVTTSGDIYVGGSGNAITITGSLTGGASSSSLLYNVGNNTINFSGTASSSADSNYGMIRMAGSQKTVTAIIGGEITYSGDSGSAITYDASGTAQLTLNGTISVTGDNSFAIKNYSGNANTTITGNITTTGSGSHAIWRQGSSYGSTTTITGTVSATGTNAYAIYNKAGTNNKYTIGEGAKIIGDLYLLDSGGTAGNTLKFDVGSSMSYVFDTTGSWTLEDLDSRPVVAGSAMAAGIGNAETADELQYSRLSNLNTSLGSSSVSNLDDNAWVNPYYSSSERKADAVDPTIEDYKTTSQGFVAGIPVASKQYGVLFGLDKTNLDIHSKTQEIDVTSARVGLYVPNISSSDELKVTAKTTLGYNKYDMTRKVLVNSDTTTGITDYTADYKSWELTSGVDAQLDKPVNDHGTSLIAGGGLDVVYEAIGSYSETANFSWKSRKLAQGVGNLKLGIKHSPSDSFSAHAIASLEARRVISGKTTKYQINSTDVTFSGGDFNDTVRKLNLGMSYKTETGADLSFNIFGSQSNNDTETLGATANLSWKF